MRRIKNNAFLQKCKIGILLVLLTVIVSVIKAPATAYAFHVTPIDCFSVFAGSI